MREKVFKVLILLVALIMIVNISYAKFITKINGKGTVKLKIPILILEKNNLISGEISKEKNAYQTDFCLKNYFESNQKINEIEFKYSIKLIPSTANFPASYKIINLNTNEEISINENLETIPITIGTEKTIHKYRLIVNWAELDTVTEVDENLEVNVKINAIQIEKEN